MSVDEQLAWEAQQRPRAAIAAAVAGVLTLGGGIYTGVGFRNLPQAGFLDSLDHATSGKPIGGLPSLKVPLYEYYSDHIANFVISALINAAGSLAVGLALTFLAYATRARREQLPKIALRLPLIGAVLVAVGGILYAIGTKSTVDKLLAGTRTVDSVKALSGGSLDIAGQLLEVVGRFGLGAGYVMICLNGMRAGLLTRFMGVLGILVGVLLVLPLLQGPPVVQGFWLFALAALFAGYWRGEVPSAWRTGKAEPWPTSAELRAARMEAAGKGGSRPAPAPAAAAKAGPAPELPAADAKPHPSSKKRKRKRRG